MYEAMMFHASRIASAAIQWVISSSTGLTIQYADRYIPLVRLGTNAPILVRFQGLVKVLWTSWLVTKTAQHNPIMAATAWAPRSVHLLDYEPGSPKGGPLIVARRPSAP